MGGRTRIEADYFDRNADRMRYPKFRKQHLFVGFGVIEAGCKTVIFSRLKKSGMCWTVRGANAIVALRCCHLNGRDWWPDSHFYVALNPHGREPPMRWLRTTIGPLDLVAAGTF